MYKQTKEHNAVEKYPVYAAHGNTYTVLFYSPQAPSHKHLHKTHKRKEKRSREFPFRVVPVGPLVRAESWQKGARAASSAPYRDYGLVALAPARPSSSSTTAGKDARTLEPKTSARQEEATRAHPRAPELQARERKERDRNQKYRSFSSTREPERRRRTGPSTREP